MISYALGGYMSLNGHPEREPLTGGGRQPAYQGGLHGYSGTMAAIMAREQSGRGQHVDISIQACMASIHQFTINRYVYVGRIQKRIGNRYPRAHPITIYPCKDGLVSLAVSQQDQCERFLALTGLTELVNDARFATTFSCSEHSDAFDERLAPWLQAQAAGNTALAMVPGGAMTSMARYTPSLLGMPIGKVDCTAQYTTTLVNNKVY